MNIKDSYIHNGTAVLKDIKVESSVLKKILAGKDANDAYLDWETVCDLTGIKPTAAGTADKVGHKLTFSGGVTGDWDGSEAKTVAIPTKSSWNYDDVYLKLIGGDLTGKLTIACTGAGEQLEIWRKDNDYISAITFSNGATTKTVLGLIGLSGSAAVSNVANNRPFVRIGDSTYYQLVHSTAKTAVGGSSTPVYVDTNGQIKAGTALGTASTHAHGDYVTSVSYDATNKKLQQSKGGGTATDIVTFGSLAFDSTEYLPLTGGTINGILTISPNNASAQQAGLILNDPGLNGSEALWINWTSGSYDEGVKLMGTPDTNKLKFHNGTAWYEVYHSGNLSIGTLMGSTAIGDSDEPVYWNGSTFVKAGAYPTKASWNYDDVYLKLTGNGTTNPMTGTIYMDNVDGIIINSHNKDLNIWEVYGNSGAWASQYGFNLQYLGTGYGNDNDLILWAHAQTAATHVEVYRVHQDGSFIFKAAPKVGTNTVYHAGNLTIKTLMGTTAIGDANEPVYWSGSAFVKAGAYPTKASWNYDDIYLKDLGLDTGNSTDKNKDVSLTNGNVYLKLFKTVNGAESEDSKVKIYGATNVSVTTDSSGDIKITGVDSVTSATYAANVGTAGTAGTNYVTAANVISMYSWYNTITATDEASNTAIDKWQEILDFLAGVTDTSTLSGILAGYAASNHDHDDKYLKLTGGTLSGTLSVSNSNSKVVVANTSYNTSISLYASQNVGIWNEKTQAWILKYSGGSLYSGSNLIWHEGNDGASSGLDADLLDGNHASAFALAENTYGTTGNFVNGIYSSNYVARGDLGLVGFDNSPITVELYEAASGSSYPASPTKTITVTNATYGADFRKGAQTTMHTCSAGAKLKIIVKSSGNYIKAVGVYVGAGGNTIAFASTVGSTTKTGSFATHGSWHVFSCMHETTSSITLELNTTNVNYGIIIGGFRTYITNPNQLRFPGVANSADSVAWSNISGKPNSFTPGTHEHGASDITSGTFSVARGGTGLNTIDIYSLLYASAADTLTALSPNTTSTKKFLRMTGTGSVGAAPAWDTVTSSDVGLGNVENTKLSTWAGTSSITTVGTISSGTWQGTTIGVGYGGTGKSSWTKNGIIYASDTTTLAQITVPSTASKTYWLKCITNGSGIPSYSFDELPAYPTWDTLSGKPNTFTPSAHDHTELKFAEDSQSSADAFVAFTYLKYSRRLLAGATGLFEHVSDNNANTILYIPTSGNVWGTQLGFNGDAEIYTRAYQGSSLTGVSWKKILNSSNYTDYTVTKSGTGATGTWGISITGNAGSASAVAWDNVTGKPSSFTPASHTHSVVSPSANGFVSSGQARRVECTRIDNAGTYKIATTSRSGVSYLSLRINETQSGRFNDVILYFSESANTPVNCVVLDLTGTSSTTFKFWYYRNTETDKYEIYLNTTLARTLVYEWALNTGTTTTIEVESVSAVPTGSAEFNWYSIINSSVSGGGDSWGNSITVKINGTSKTLTIPAKPTYGFSDLTSHPTTLSGYGITDAVPSSTYYETGVVSAQVTKSLSNTTWVDSEITFPTAAGTYALLLTTGGSSLSGIFSVGTSDVAKDEISLHMHGNGPRLYARTNGTSLQLSSNDASATSRSVTIKYRRMI